MPEEGMLGKAVRGMIAQTNPLFMHRQSLNNFEASVCRGVLSRQCKLTTSLMHCNSAGTRMDLSMLKQVGCRRPLKPDST